VTAPKLFNASGRPRGEPTPLAVECLRLEREGLTRWQIAERLGIVRGTVDRCIGAAMESERGRQR